MTTTTATRFVADYGLSIGWDEELQENLVTFLWDRSLQKTSPHPVTGSFKTFVIDADAHQAEFLRNLPADYRTQHGIREVSE